MARGRGDRPRDWAFPVSPRKIARGERIELPPGCVDLAKRRTDYLLRMTHRSLEDLIANAWVQGVLDAGEHMTAKPQT